MADLMAALQGRTTKKPGSDRDFEAWLRGDQSAPSSTSGAPISSATDADQRYAIATLERLAGDVAMAVEGARNDTLNTRAIRAYRVADAYGLGRQIVTDRMTEAGYRCGLGDSEIASTLRSARAGADKYGPAQRDRSESHQLGNTTFIHCNPEDAQAAAESPAYTDFAALLSGGLPEPPKPTVLHRDDGTAVFYRRKRNDLHGDPEDGKTMVALAAAVHDLTTTNGGVLFLDFDNNGPAETAQRLIMLGADPSVLADRNRFRHIEPADAQEVLRVVADCAGWATLVIGDCVGEVMPLFRASSDSADDYTRVMQQVSSPLEQGGAAVIWLDHQAKGAESRNYGAGGTMAKRRAVSGVSINLVRKQSFVPGQGGMADLWINKDRPGGLRAHCPKGEGRRQFAGTFVLDAPDPATGVATWRVTADRAEPSTTLAIDPVMERHHAAVVALGEMGQAATVAAVAAHANGLPDETAATQNQKVNARRYLTKLTEAGRLTKVLQARPEQWKAAA